MQYDKKEYGLTRPLISLIFIIFATLSIGSPAQAKIDSLKIYLTRGGGALQQGNHQYAKESFESALRTDSLNVMALKSMGIIASANGFNRRALGFFSRALINGADDAGLHHNLAVTYEILNQTDSCFASHTKSIELDPENFGYLQDYGAALMNASRFSNAIVILQKALSVDPTSGQTLYMIGNCYAALPDPASAVESYKKALDLKYDTGKLHYHLGMNYLNSGDKLGAEEHLGFAVGKAPDSLQFRQSLATFYLQAGVPDQARNFFSQNLERDSTFLNSRIGLGVAYAYLGEMESAYAELATVKSVSQEKADAMNIMIDQALNTLRLIDSLNKANSTSSSSDTKDQDGK